MTAQLYLQLRCADCGRREVIGSAQMLERLRGLGMLKREKEPAADLIRTLYEARLADLACPACGHRHLILEPLAQWDDESWDTTRPCQQCGQPIAAERLEVLPAARLCAACQQSQEHGSSDEEPEFCPRCGEIMSLRLDTSAGISRYVMFCPGCGKRG